MPNHFCHSISGFQAPFQHYPRGLLPEAAEPGQGQRLRHLLHMQLCLWCRLFRMHMLRGTASCYQVHLAGTNKLFDG